ncbi:D-2-hydroxyacid dehydrogenase [Haloplanus sp. GCM10025708]|uniref:D-2-hydroxyacid dehydrogenase n=1 Tax=Haloplanus sp. GCM10025708 TaxID=3252679 RepID=UPI00360BCD86
MGRARLPPENLRDYLADAVPEVAVVSTADAADCDALVTFEYTDDFLGTDIEWIHTIQAGYDRFDTEAMAADDIAFTNSTGIHDESVGETAACYMLMFARLLHRYRWSQRDHEWDRPDWHEPFTVADNRLCVVGLGTLGQGIATRADALGMDVVGVKRTVEPVDGVRKVYPADELHEAIGDADFVALAVPLTDGTRGLVGASELERMDDDAYLINVSRGPVVDQSALVSALESGAIAGAGLDVFEEEPLPDDSPLWDMENVVVTPHTAAHTRDYFRLVGDILRENVDRLAAGREMKNWVA